MRIHLSVPAGVDYWIELEGDNITAHTRVDEYVHGDERLDITLSAGTYYIKVTGFSFDDVNSYTVTLTAPLTGDDFEPNNTPDTSTPLQLGATIGSFLFTRNDADWYRIVTTAEAYLVVSLDVPNTADYDLVLTDAAGSYHRTCPPSSAPAGTNRLW